MVGWHHRLNGHEFVYIPGIGDGQGGLVCCISWGHKELHTTEWLNWITYTKKTLWKCQWGIVDWKAQHANTHMKLPTGNPVLKGPYSHLTAEASHWSLCSHLLFTQILLSHWFLLTHPEPLGLWIHHSLFWRAIVFKMLSWWLYVCSQSLSCVQLFVTPWTI